MARTKNPHGFKDWIEKGEITPDFYEDYQMLCMKIYAHSKLKCSYEDFVGYCVEKLLVSLPRFDVTKGSLPTYLFNLILNESRRLYSKSKHAVEVEFKPEIDSSMDEEATDSLLFKTYDFCMKAYKMGVFVNQKALIADYMAGVKSPVLKSFLWICSRSSI